MGREREYVRESMCACLHLVVLMYKTTGKIITDPFSFATHASVRKETIMGKKSVKCEEKGLKM